MAHLIIKNVGPIKHVDIELNKVNIIMGPQSSGKSTIAKIVSFCSWLDKSMAKKGTKDFSEGINNGGYFKLLQDYHRLSGSYFTIDSVIDYNGAHISFKIKKDNPNQLRCTIGFHDLQRGEASKVIYIPAERNFVSVVPNLKKYAEDRDNLQDFIQNWYEAKRKYSADNKLTILDLGVEYYNTESEDIDRLVLTNGNELQLRIASSGLQSLVPLIILIDYLARGIYNESRPISVEERDLLIKEYNNLVDKRNSGDKSIDKNHLLTLLDMLVSRDYHYSQFIIEEPEQNLFPSTQRDLMYYILHAMLLNERHTMLITTHSPYILYALNNCMMGYLVKDKMPEQEANEVSCRNAWINPELVSVWEIKDGELRTTSESRNNTIQGEDGLISDNYFDENMKEVMDDFYKMLNYYGDDKDED